jgi:alcohol dehydrogenase class IV
MPNKEPPVGEFDLSRLERGIYRPGKIAALKDEMERRDLHRGLVVATDVVAELPILKEVTGALGSRCVGVFAGVVMQVPRKTTELLQKEIERLEVDSLISFGGGSPIDSCKVAAYGLLPGLERMHIAVPTTLSAAEYTWGGGVTASILLHEGGTVVAILMDGYEGCSALGLPLETHTKRG